MGILEYWGIGTATMIRKFLISAMFLVGLTVVAFSGAVVAQEGPAFDVRGEIVAAEEELSRVLMNMGGMGGLGMPEPDIQALNGILDEAAKLLRQAKRYAQNLETVHDQGWSVAYARASLSIAQVAAELGDKLGHSGFK